MRQRVAGSVAVFAIAAAALSGCGDSPRGVTVPAGGEALPICAETPMPVSDLAELGAPGCNLVGSTLTFEEVEGRFDIETIRYPGGVPSLTVTDVGATFSQGDGQGRNLMMVNWGVPGVAVALIDNGELVEIWASSDAALDLHHQALEADGVPVEWRTPH